MKLMIDIPEQIYLNAKADTLCGADILVKAIKNGIPHESVTEFADRCKECGREKVLDKIRAEIEEYKSRQLTLAIGVNDLEQGKQIALEYVLAIIDKYKQKVR